jgi:molybdopterin converting factor small subunit
MNVINIMPFGQIAEITGAATFALTAVDTDGIRHLLASRYPELETRRYAIAVDKVIVKENTVLNPGAVVALLPPFSGG